MSGKFFFSTAKGPGCPPWCCKARRGSGTGAQRWTRGPPIGLASKTWAEELWIPGPPKKQSEIHRQKMEQPYLLGYDGECVTSEIWRLDSKGTIYVHRIYVLKLWLWRSHQLILPEYELIGKFQPDAYLQSQQLFKHRSRHVLVVTLGFGCCADETGRIMPNPFLSHSMFVYEFMERWHMSITREHRGALPSLQFP